MKTKPPVLFVVWTFAITCPVWGGPEQAIDQKTHSAVVDGMRFQTECSPAPPEAASSSKFVMRMVIQNSDRIRPGDPEFPSDYCPADARAFATSVGDGDGSMGPFGFTAQWCALPGGIVWARRDVFHTEHGDIVADERFESSPQPDGTLQFTGEFTIVDGTGRYRNIRGHARAAGAQLNGAYGRTAIVACGWFQQPTADD